jgi:hypothetical protein
MCRSGLSLPQGGGGGEDVQRHGQSLNAHKHPVHSSSSDAAAAMLEKDAAFGKPMLKHFLIREKEFSCITKMSNFFVAEILVLFLFSWCAYIPCPL